jgi:hypothetical protein
VPLVLAPMVICVCAAAHAGSRISIEAAARTTLAKIRPDSMTQTPTWKTSSTALPNLTNYTGNLL